MTHDVMSDCVGGDYVIVKNWKKWRNWWGDFQKGDETWHFLKALKWIFRVSSVPILKIMALYSPYENLEGFKVAPRQKNDFISKRFLSLLFSVNSYNQKLPNRHTRQSDDTFDTFGGVPEVIPFLKIAPPIS